MHSPIRNSNLARHRRASATSGLIGSYRFGKRSRITPFCRSRNLGRLQRLAQAARIAASGGSRTPGPALVGDVVFGTRGATMLPDHWNLASIFMRWCLRITHSTRQLGRHSLNWRTARLFCAVWFTLTSIGLPGSLSLMTENSCARKPGSQCHCSLAKRMSGTCCCGRESQQQLVKTCCSAKKSALKVTESTGTGCCSSKSKPQRAAATSPRAELSISRCDCGSESPENVSLAQEPRLPVTVAAISFPEMNVAFVASPADRVESALLLPPVPPPKIVL